MRLTGLEEEILDVLEVHNDAWNVDDILDYLEIPTDKETEYSERSAISGVLNGLVILGFVQKSYVISEYEKTEFFKITKQGKMYFQNNKWKLVRSNLKDIGIVIATIAAIVAAVRWW